MSRVNDVGEEDNDASGPNDDSMSVVSQCEPSVIQGSPGLFMATEAAC